MSDAEFWNGANLFMTGRWFHTAMSSATRAGWLRLHHQYFAEGANAAALTAIAGRAAINPYAESSPAGEAWQEGHDEVLNACRR